MIVTNVVVIGVVSETEDVVEGESDPGAAEEETVVGVDEPEAEAVSGHQVVYTVIRPWEVVVAKDTNAGDVVSSQALWEQDVIDTIVVVSWVIVSVEIP